MAYGSNVLKLFQSFMNDQKFNSLQFDPNRLKIGQDLTILQQKSTLSLNAPRIYVQGFSRYLKKGICYRYSLLFSKVIGYSLLLTSPFFLE